MADYQAQCSSNRYITLLLRTQVVSQDVAGNTSTINWSLHVLKSSASTSATWGNCSYGVTINGNAYSGSGQVRVEAGGDTVLLTGTTVIPHNADGTKSFNLSASISGYIVGSLSESEALATIPRASTITCGTFTMGSAGVITIARASSGFTHTITWNFGAASGTVVTKTTSTSVPWTPPTATLAPQIPAAAAGIGLLTCITYSGNTEIGRTAINFIANLPASVVPSISAVTAAEATAGLAAKFGAFVQYKSTLKVSVSAAGIYGSTISGYSISFDGKPYSGNPCTTAAPTQSGSLTLTATVTDTRGRSASKSIAVTVQPYANPAITAFAPYRCNADGAADDSGDYVGITYAYSVAPVNSKNAATAKIEAKRSTLTSWSTLLTNGAYSATTTVFPDQELLSDYQYDLRITVSDYFGSTSMTVTLPSAEVILDLLATGQGIAIGKTSELEETMDISWSPIFRQIPKIRRDYPALYFQNQNGEHWASLWVSKASGPFMRQDAALGGNYTILDTGNTSDHIVAQGVSNGWVWRKWDSGIAECAKVFNNTDMSTFGSYRYVHTSFPFAFNAVPVVVGADFSTLRIDELAPIQASVRGVSSTAVQAILTTTQTTKGSFGLYAIGTYNL